MQWIVPAYCLLIVLVAGLGEVRSDAKADAKDAFERGIALQNQDDYIGAAKAFEESVAAYANKSNLYNLANCYRALNQPKDALLVFQRIKREFYDKLSAEMTQDVDTQIKEITDALVQLTVKTLPEGATVTVDDEVIGRTPIGAPILLNTGEHFIAISKDGYETIHWRGTFNSGARDEKLFTLKGSKAPSSPTSVAQPIAPKTKEMPASLPLSDKPRLKKFAPMFLAGVSGAALMAGVSTGLWAATFHRNNDYEEKNDKLRKQTESEWDDTLKTARDEDRRASDNYNKAAVVTTIVTGAFAAVTVTAVVLQARKNRETRVSLLPGGVEVRF